MHFKAKDEREAASASLLVLRGVSKSFGPVEALKQVDLVVSAGELIGLVGHNGAGKSTLMNILMGVVQYDRGEFLLGGEAVRQPYSPAIAHRLGVRCVFQELSLCPNLSAIESTLLIHPKLGGLGWEKRAGALIAGALDEIFPGHHIDIRRPASDLPIGERQMIEIARSFTESDAPAKLVILDEPTSSLDSTATAQLLAFLRKAVAEKLACILITHKLNEVLGHTRRIVVMKDATVVADVPASELSHDRLFELMGAVEGGSSGAVTARVARGERRIRTAGRGRRLYPPGRRRGDCRPGRPRGPRTEGSAAPSSIGPRATGGTRAAPLPDRRPMSAAIGSGRVSFLCGRSRSTSHLPVFAASHTAVSSPAERKECWRRTGG